jgi:hypothetical protein
LVQKLAAWISEEKRQVSIRKNPKERRIRHLFWLDQKIM